MYYTHFNNIMCGFSPSLTARGIGRFNTNPKVWHWSSPESFQSKPHYW